MAWPFAAAKKESGAVAAEESPQPPQGLQADDKSKADEPELEQERIEDQIAEALACPCVEELRAGPCGKSFELAFSCFLRHEATHKDDGEDMDCMQQFEAMRECMVKNPEAFMEFAYFQQSREADRLARDAAAS